MSELIIVAKIVAKAKHRDEIVEALQIIVDETRKESGNISYDLHQDLNDELKFTLLEVWKSQEAIGIHNNSLHFANFKDFIVNKVDDLQIDIIKKIH